MTAMRGIWGLVFVLVLAGDAVCAAPGPWEQPAAMLAEQVAGLLGPGQARLTVRNVSSIANDEIPAIRRLLELDLKGHGVVASGEESANLIRLTLSESARTRVWVAEVVEGSETRVAMVEAGLVGPETALNQDRISLQKEVVLGNFSFSLPPIVTNNKPILAAESAGYGMVVLRPDDLLFLAMTTAGWRVQQTVSLEGRASFSRDTRGAILSSLGGDRFTAFVPGRVCTGEYSSSTESTGRIGDWTVHCHESDDPWPIAGVSAGTGATPLKAFYNAARNYFTGVVTPALGMDLPPFYAAAVVPRQDGSGMLIEGLDRKVQMAERGGLKAVSGTRDWGSDFAVLQPECSSEAQVVVSGSGEAAEDSLRAYELPGMEAVPVSAALAVGGTVTALWTAPDGKSVLAVVRNGAGEYEVDRVTASCN